MPKKRNIIECFHEFQAENLEKIILVLYNDSSVHSAKQLGYTVHETYNSPHKKVNHPEVGEQIAEVAKVTTEVAKAAIDWLADPENQEKIKSLVSFAMKTLALTGMLSFGKASE